MIKTLLISALSILFIAYSHRGNVVDFDYIEKVISDSPEKAIVILDSIDRSSLTEADRHLTDLLSIEARDKAYITHTSDSLVLNVMDYYSSHKDDRLYPLALYYGGRVYSDLGDYPTALRYFQSALDVIPENMDNLELKAAALSQTGRLLRNIRLPLQAIPYLEKAIEAGKLLDDTFGLAYDYSHLYQCFTHVNDLPSARRCNAEAMKYSEALPAIEQADMKIDLALLLYQENKIDSALYVIRGLPDRVDPLRRCYALAVAAEIYRDAGVPDSAYVYARELALAGNDNSRIGFKIMFAPELKSVVPEDTLRFYLPQYKQTIEKYLAQHDAKETLIQNSLYNYQLHVRDKEKAETARNRMYFLVYAILALAAFVIIGLLYLRTRNLRQIVHLQKALNTIKTLRYDQADNSKSLEPTTSRISACSETEILRRQILHEFESMENADSSAFSVRQGILCSEAFRRLEEVIRKQKSIPDSDDLWGELAMAVEKDSPDFKVCLATLTNCKMSNADFQIALLIRCGISPSNMAILLNRTKSTISSRRSSLCCKIFGPGQSIKLLDPIICYL